LQKRILTSTEIRSHPNEIDSQYLFITLKERGVPLPGVQASVAVGKKSNSTRGKSEGDIGNSESGARARATR
jgi:hypothetical protein